MTRREPPVHGLRGYKHGCRCDVCREAGIGRVARWHAEVKGQEPPAHGHSGYSNYGCRCDQCRAGMREYMRDYRARKRAR